MRAIGLHPAAPTIHFRGQAEMNATAQFPPLSPGDQASVANRARRAKVLESPRWRGSPMNKFQSFAMGLFLMVLAIAAFMQIIDVDPIMRRVSIAAVSAVSLIAAMVFFLFAVKNRD
jgi:hypothetical protein